MPKVGEDKTWTEIERLTILVQVMYKLKQIEAALKLLDQYNGQLLLILKCECTISSR